MLKNGEIKYKIILIKTNNALDLSIQFGKLRA